MSQKVNAELWKLPDFEYSSLMGSYAAVLLGK